MWQPQLSHEIPAVEFHHESGTGVVVFGNGGGGGGGGDGDWDSLVASG